MKIKNLFSKFIDYNYYKNCTRGKEIAKFVYYFHYFLLVKKEIKKKRTRIAANLLLFFFFLETGFYRINAYWLNLLLIMCAL